MPAGAFVSLKSPSSLRTCPQGPFLAQKVRLDCPHARRGLILGKGSKKNESGGHWVDLTRLSPGGGSALNVVFGHPWGGQQEGKENNRNLTRLLTPRGRRI